MSRRMRIHENPMSAAGKPRMIQVEKRTTAANMGSDLLRASAEGSGKLFVDALEAAVGEDRDYIPRHEARRNLCHDGVGVRQQGRGFTGGGQGGDNVFRMESLGGRDSLRLINAGEDDLVSKREAVDEFALEDVAAEGVAARLENGPEAAARIGRTQSAEGFADRGGMVGEVIDDRDAVDFSANLEAAAHRAKGGEGFDDGIPRKALAGGERGGGRGIEGVVLSGDGHRQIGPGLAGAEQGPAAEAIVVAEIGHAPGRICSEAVAFDGAERARDAI